MKKYILFTLFTAVLFSISNVYAQYGEPEVEEIDAPRSLFDEGYKAGFGFNFVLNDFGFGAGGQFRLGISSYTEAIFNFKLAGLKDPTEQTFVDYFGGRIIPGKYRRVFSTPVYIGLKQRLFAKDISDNFRLYTSISAGPVFAWSIAYFNDNNENGFRENDQWVYGGYVEPVHDIFNGWDELESHWGFGGEIMLGIDFGENFANLSSVQFGYTMNYFKDGIQIMEPYQADLNSQGLPQYTEGGELILEPANEPRNYFGSAQISFIFGWMW